MTTEDAAKALGVCERRIRQMCADGTLSATRFGRKALAICEESVRRAATRPRQWKK
jgi:excisionase family DNA binding protein